MKRIISIIILAIIIQIQCLAAQFDDTIDKEIRQEYKVEDNELPALPKTVPTAGEYESIAVPKYNPTGKTYTLKSGTKLSLRLNKTISDKSPKGSKTEFSMQNGITAQDGTIIPAGTIVKGEITNSHGPQLTGNSGLIELKIDKIYFNGIMSEIETKVCRANEKKIFLGNIKGKRLYGRNMLKSMKPGIKVFKGAEEGAHRMSTIPIIEILSPVIWIGGGAVYAVNAVCAPIISIFKKGDHISLPAGTLIQVKLTSNSLIKG